MNLAPNWLITFLICAPVLGQSQDVGIHFEKVSSWNEILEKAKADRKFVFVDCYATWCAPCKVMSQNIFPLKEVGDFMNARFISVRIQMDTTVSDNDTIKAWYGEAHEMLEKYRVNSFPTYLYFSPDGHIVHRAGGATDNPGSFTGMSGNALDEHTQYYTLLNKYNSGDRDSAVLKELAVIAMASGDQQTARTMTNSFMDAVKSVYELDNLRLLGKLNTGTKDRVFDLWITHALDVNAIMGNDYAERKVMNAIMLEDSNVVSANKKAVEGLEIVGYVGAQPMYKPPAKDAIAPTAPDWLRMHAGIKRTYGVYYADRITKWVKLSYYRTRNQWKPYTASILDYVTSYESTIKAVDLNRFAWDIFTYSKDSAELSQALLWSKHTLNTDNGPLNTFYDTYANLLYKLGRKEEAVDAERKAVLITPEREKQSYLATLSKMQKGERTWSD